MWSGIQKFSGIYLLYTHTIQGVDSQAILSYTIYNRILKPNQWLTGTYHTDPNEIGNGAAARHTATKHIRINEKTRLTHQKKKKKEKKMSATVGQVTVAYY